MIKDIKYSGLSVIPSDYECPDGQLAVSMNLLSEDSQIKPLCQPVPRDIGLQPEQRALFIHKSVSSYREYKHFIILQEDPDTLFWSDANSDNPELNLLKTFGANSSVQQINAIGNTLIVLCSDAIHYFLWKDDSTGYNYLGSKFPECSLSFGLQAEMKRTDEFQINFEIPEDDIYNDFDDDTKPVITDQVLAKVNKFIADESTSKGKFIYPFFVRYAYRLYDGSLTMHSAPILMICSSEIAPRVFWYDLHLHGDKYTDAKLRVVSPVHSLDYACKSMTAELAPWSDIIKSVDIFISKPIYTYDQNDYCEKFIQGGTDLSAFSVCRHTNQAADTETYPLRYQKNDFGKLYAFTFTPQDLTSRPGGVLVTPKRSADAVKEDIRNCSQFYFLHSIRIEDLQDQRTLIPVKEDYLQSLVAREVMTDDYDSHDTLIADHAFAYNSRLNLSGIKKILFQGYDANSLFNYSDGYVYNWANDTPTAMDTRASVTVAVYIKQDGKDIIVYCNAGSCSPKAPLLFFYYPNINAYKAVIIRSNYIDEPHIVIPLEQHASLNGAFYFDGWEEPQGVHQDRPAASSLLERTIDIPNKVYTSEINNPFLFPLLGINTVGTGKILGISTAAKALSQGQFGQFPLYAFTTEGVWALEVSSTGTYSAKQPITRDVCKSPESITQIDSAVIFATDRGLMLISGANTQCISESINTQTPFDSYTLPGFDTLHAFLDHQDNALYPCFPTKPFSQFLANCRMLYDYVHQRIIVFNKAFSYAYVYSMKSHEWGMLYSTIKEGINSYPEALATDHDGRLLNFSSTDPEQYTGLKGLMISRPFKLEAPDVLKTIDTVIQRGHFFKTDLHSVLYGSRDLFNWQLIWSSKDYYLRGFRGTPFKYFRIACLTNLNNDESIFGATIQFNPRHTNQPR